MSRRGKKSHRKEAKALDDDERFRLYESAVQSPAFEVFFFEQVFDDAFTSSPTRLREDFCGTGAVARAFVSSTKMRRAVGVDIDPVVVRAATAAAALDDSVAPRIDFVVADVCEYQVSSRYDVVAAENFSWCGIHSRRDLRDYFKKTLEALDDKGVLILDCLGGSAREEPGAVDSRDVGPCVMHFRQSTFDVVTRRAQFHIDFTLGGVTYRDAFTYDWRLWTIPETRDILLDAGFDDVIIYWEQRDAFGAPTSRFQAVQAADGRKKWVAYLVGVKARV